MNRTFVSDTAWRLNAAAAELAPKLLPDGKRAGHYWQAVRLSPSITRTTRPRISSGVQAARAMRLDRIARGKYIVHTLPIWPKRRIMQTKIVKMGNSRGIRIPKAMLELTGLEDEVDLRVDGTRLIVEPMNDPRAGWEEAAMEQARDPEAGKRLLPDFFEDEDLSDWKWDGDWDDEDDTSTGSPTRADAGTS
jgi:antitoxin MazE